jgi:hypothetical protein
MRSLTPGALVLVASLLACGAARAQQEAYDPDHALAQSLGYSLGVAGVGGLLLLAEPTFGAATLGLGLSIAPSLGHFYADNWVQGILTLGARLIASVAAVVGLIAAAFPEEIDSSAEPDEWTRKRVAFLAVGLAGAACTLGLVAFDIATAPGAARRANSRVEQARSRPRWTAWLAPGGGGVAVATAF